MRAADLAKRIDHTVLKPDAAERTIAALCEEAAQYGFYAVCVNPCWVSTAVALLRGTAVKTCSVAGFPLGANTSAIKAAEAAAALADGATEVDMVLNVGRLVDGCFPAVAEDIAAVRRATEGAILKVIIEAALLTDEQKARAAEIVVATGADFVKTSTGFSAAGGATIEDVRLLRSVVGNRARVKAAGGIRDLTTALAMVEAGADRIGTSASVGIIRECMAPPDSR